MKSDPNAGCPNHGENLAWAIIHDLLAHPLMALTGYGGWAIRFHDYTSRKAWPRDSVDLVMYIKDAELLQKIQDHYRAKGVSHMVEARPQGNGYKYLVSKVTK